MDDTKVLRRTSITLSDGERRRNERTRYKRLAEIDNLGFQPQTSDQIVAAIKFPTGYNKGSIAGKKREGARFARLHSNP